MTKAVKQVGILGVGSYLPSKILTNHDLEKMVDTSDEWIVQRTGIRTRHIAAPEQATSDMALIAARRALHCHRQRPRALVIAKIGVQPRRAFIP